MKEEKEMSVLKKLLNFLQSFAILLVQFFANLVIGAYLKAADSLNRKGKSKPKQKKGKEEETKWIKRNFGNMVVFVLGGSMVLLWSGALGRDFQSIPRQANILIPVMGLFLMAASIFDLVKGSFSPDERKTLEKLAIFFWALVLLCLLLIVLLTKGMIVAFWVILVLAIIVGGFLVRRQFS